MKTIVITDLDGTLLDAVTYSFDEALPAVEALRRKKIPLVLSSSKTRREIELYRSRLENTDPFVSENGGGIFIPRGYFPFSASERIIDGYEAIVLGRPYGELRKALEETREATGVRVRGFGDMAPFEIALKSGLDIKEAALARMRDFGEPFVFEGSSREEIRRFLLALEKRGLRWTRGRFYHLMGENDKGRALRVLRSLYERRFGRVMVIALGDGLNDLPLLKAADRAVLVPHPDGTYEEAVVVEGLIRASRPGPAGWNETVLKLIEEGAPDA